jgi:hypothetical protein
MGWLRGRRQPQRGSQGQPGEPKTGAPIAGSVSPYAAGLIEDQRKTWQERLRAPEPDPAAGEEPRQARRPGVVQSGPGTLNIVAEAIPGGTGADGRSDDEVQITARDELNISQPDAKQPGLAADTIHRS